MTIQRMDHAGSVVDDLAATTAFLVEPGLKLQGKGSVEGGQVTAWWDSRSSGRDFAMLVTPDGHGRSS